MDHALVGFAPRKHAVRTAAGVAVIGATSLWLPLVGLPLAAGAAAYTVFRLSHLPVFSRRRRIFTRHRHRIALIFGCAVIAIAGTFCDALYSFHVAKGLESQLGNRIEAAQRQGTLRLGQVFHACGWAACASATITRLPAGQFFGVASLSGFTISSQKMFGWHLTAEAERAPR